MPNVVRNDEHLKDESKQNKNEQIPVKNKSNDAVKNTADEIGLNQAATDKNELEPGTEIADDEQLLLYIIWKINFVINVTPNTKLAAKYYRN